MRSMALWFMGQVPLHRARTAMLCVLLTSALVLLAAIVDIPSPHTVDNFWSVNQTSSDITPPIIDIVIGAAISMACVLAFLFLQSRVLRILASLAALFTILAAAAWLLCAGTGDAFGSMVPGDPTAGDSMNRVNDGIQLVLHIGAIYVLIHAASQAVRYRSDRLHRVPVSPPPTVLLPAQALPTLARVRRPSGVE